MMDEKSARDTEPGSSGKKTAPGVPGLFFKTGSLFLFQLYLDGLGLAVLPDDINL